MPLKCLREGEEIYAFDMESDEAWEALRRGNAERTDLTMPCCGAAVVLRTSPLGTRHFAHARKGPCKTAPETKEHLLAKRIVIEGIRRTRWDGRPEQEGETPTGDKWTADVLASERSRKVAFEIQWSRQDAKETRRRQERYAISDVRGLWLFRQIDFPFADKDCPSFRLVFDGNLNGFSVWLPSNRWHPSYVKPERRDEDGYWIRKIELSRFVEGVLSGRLIFAPSLGEILPLDVMTVSATCRRCGKRTRLVVGIVFAASRVFPGHPDIRVSLRLVESLPGGTEAVLDWLPKILLRKHGIGEVKVRESGLDVENRASYLSNGCVSCGAMQTRWAEERIDDDPEAALTVAAVFDPAWVEHMPGSRDWCLWWFDKS